MHFKDHEYPNIPNKNPKTIVLSKRLKQNWKLHKKVKWPFYTLIRLLLRDFPLFSTLPWKCAIIHYSIILTIFKHSMMNWTKAIFWWRLKIVTWTRCEIPNFNFTRLYHFNGDEAILLWLLLKMWTVEYSCSVENLEIIITAFTFLVFLTVNGSFNRKPKDRDWRSKKTFVYSPIFLISWHSIFSANAKENFPS